MKKIITYFSLVFMVLALLVASGCGSNNDNNKKVAVAFANSSASWQRNGQNIKQDLEKQGFTTDLQFADTAEQQADQLRAMLEENPKCIIIGAVNSEALTDALKAAKEKKIPVISYDRLIMNANSDLYISFDNEMVGTMMAEALVANLPAGSNILSICGSPTDQNVSQANRGFDAVIAKSDLNVIVQEYAPNWLAETAYSVVNKALADGLVFDGVRCGNDDLASQAFLALSEHRLASTVKLVGQDADLAACQRIVEGTQLMTVYKPVEKLAKEAAEMVVKLVRGESLAVSDTIFDGVYTVPYKKLVPIMVTRDNIDEVIIDGGFHRREQVYLNLD